MVVGAKSTNRPERLLAAATLVMFTAMFAMRFLLSWVLFLGYHRQLHQDDGDWNNKTTGVTMNSDLTVGAITGVVALDKLHDMDGLT